MEDTQNQALRANIRKYFLYQFSSNLVFFGPVIVLFWQSRGLSMTQVMLLQSTYAVTTIFFELPTGAFADRFGKKLSLLMGSLFLTIGLLLYGFGRNFFELALFEATCGIGTSFISGADRAFIHETLFLSGREKEYQKVEGRARGLNQIANGIGNFFGGFIGAVSLPLTLTFSAVPVFISFLIGLFFHKTKDFLPREEKTDYPVIIKESLKIVKNNKEILWLTAFSAVFGSFAWMLIWFAQPYLQLLNVPLVYWGAIFAGFSLTAAVASSFAHRFEAITKNKPFFAMAIIVVVSLFLLGAFPSVFIFPLWSLFTAFVLINRTLMSGRVLAIVPANRSATVLSFQNLSTKLSYALIGPLIGALSDSFGLTKTLQIDAVLLAIILGILLLKKPSTI
ncbi:MAG: MFS transporter [bacterium]|nr:MFS transporter [bacterium]